MTQDFYRVVLIMILFALVLFGSTARADDQTVLSQDRHQMGRIVLLVSAAEEYSHEHNDY